MKRPYDGSWPFRVWLHAWEHDCCETLPKIRAKNSADPMKNLPVITVIVSHALEPDPDLNYADLKDLVKTQCSQRSIAYNVDVIAAALDAATRERRLL